MSITVPNVIGMDSYSAQLKILGVGLLIAPPVPVASAPGATWDSTQITFDSTAITFDAAGGLQLRFYVVNQSILAGTVVPDQTQLVITVIGFQPPGMTQVFV